MDITEFVELFGDVDSSAVTPVNRAVQILCELERIHRIDFPEKEEGSFFENVFLKLLENETVTSGEMFVRRNARAKPLTVLDVLLVPCAFVVGAIKAEKDGKRDEAWSLVCDATYWLAVRKTGMLADELAPTSINSVALAGGRGRDSTFEPMRALAKKLAQEKRYPSRRNAAMNMAPEIVKLSNDLGVNMSPSQAPITIASWLKGLTFGGKDTT